MGRKEDDGGAVGAAGRRPGRVKRALPGPPHTYTMYGTRVEALGSAAVAQLTHARREAQVAADQESTEDRAAMVVAAMESESRAAEAECRPAGVASAQQGGRGTAAEEPVVAPVEVTDGQQEEDLEPAVGGVQHSGGLLPPLSTGRTAG